MLYTLLGVPGHALNELVFLNHLTNILINKPISTDWRHCEVSEWQTKRQPCRCWLLTLGSETRRASQTLFSQFALCARWHTPCAGTFQGQRTQCYCIYVW